MSKTYNIIPIEQYFDEMELTDFEKERRISLAKRFESLFMYLFALAKFDELNIVPDINADMVEKYIEIVSEFLEFKNEVPAAVSDHALFAITSIIATTRAFIEDEYYTSQERAVLEAENESNSVLNYDEYSKAIKEGNKYKTWITMQDNRVRHTHTKLDNVRIGIFELFNVGNDLMGYPLDTTYSPSAREVVNCRCTIRYSRN